MSDHPFHVAGGTFVGKPPAKPAIDASFLTRPRADIPEPASSSRRRRLWEIPHKFHCPVVGSCFEVGELRTLMQKVMHLPRDTSDFVLHTTAVGACETRTRLADLLHKTLEKRYALTIKRFAAFKTASALFDGWKQACAGQYPLAAALWAVWTHPACDGQIEQDVYADIHMIQHQVGASTRADIKTMKALEAQNARQQTLIEDLQRTLEALRKERAEEVSALLGQLHGAQAELAARSAREFQDQRQLADLRQRLPELEKFATLRSRHDQLQQDNCTLRQRLHEQTREVDRLRDYANYAEEVLKTLVQEESQITEAELPSLQVLNGKAVLCVGGRRGAVHSYREVVEQRGGRFLHHDGGLEESLHQIDSVVAAADMVICQAGCISHNAYWRVKDLCKRTGKPCMFVKSTGVTRFAETIQHAAG